jgi:hypothetical protein
LQLIQAYHQYGVGSRPALQITKRCTQLATASDKVYHLLAQGLWFSPASSTTKTGRHDIAEILLKVTLSTINQIKSVIKQLKIDLKYILFCMYKYSENCLKRTYLGPMLVFEIDMCSAYTR